MASLRTIKDILKSIKNTKKGYRILRRYSVVYGEHPIYLRYERFSSSLDHMLAVLEARLGVEIDDDQKSHIRASTSRARNEEISKAFANFGELDEESGIHGLHISRSELTWQEVMPGWLEFLLTKIFFRRELVLYDRLARLERE
jgi:hypothetical protein